MPTSSVIIVNWNDGERLRRCLRSIEGGGHDVVVVDNASTDDSRHLVAREFPWVTLVPQPVNVGFAAGVNAGARASAGRRLLLLNTDTVAAPGAVDTLAAFLDAQPNCGAVAGQLIGDDGQPQRGWNVRRLPTLASFAVSLLLVDKIWPANPVSRRYQMLDLNYSRPVEVEQPAAACLMIRRKAFDALGGMDERFYPAWFEDVDFCRRLIGAGWRIFFDPRAVFSHQGGVARTRLGPRAFALAWYGNLERYVAKHHGRTARLAVKGLILVGMIERMLGGALGGDLRAAVTCGEVCLQALGLRRRASAPLAPAP